MSRLPLSSTVFALIAGVSLFSVPCNSATRYVNLNSPGPAAPYTDWAIAATNIQDAIDASVDGDLVLVTNGVYAVGGRVMAGDLTNRVALDKAVTVRSMSGPFYTVIRGAGSVNSPLAVRCAWLTNGASLVGFTLEAGATRTSGDLTTLANGGAVWCPSSNAVIANCVLRSSTAYNGGSAIYKGSLLNCAIVGNTAPITCRQSILNSCTVVSNASGVVQGLLTNCIVYYNTGNLSQSTASYSCTFPVAPGTGNITNAPQLLPDGFHLSAGSPCIGAGLIPASGSDIDGQSWESPPAIGCDEWRPEPVLIGQPTTVFPDDGGFALVSGMVAGLPPYSFGWIKDGELLQDGDQYAGATSDVLMIDPIRSSDAGLYQSIVSNAFGVVTGAVRIGVFCVDASNAGATPPYTNWATAARSIQSAIDAAKPGDIVLVTNGIYATGGRAIDESLTNRVALDKAVLVESMNGPFVTRIEGAGATNGSSAVRCAWITNGAVLRGFTLQSGATRTSGTNTTTYAYGGGAWCVSSNARVFNCVIRSNTASLGGGGVYRGSLYNCLLTANWSGGAYLASLRNCTVVTNNSGGGVSGSCLLTNSIVYFNVGGNYSGSTWSYCCTTPLPSGTGNISSAPQLFDENVRLMNNSPCRGAGSGPVSGKDIFGNLWATPPSMGCAEWQPAPNVVAPVLRLTNDPIGYVLSLSLSGQEPLTCWWLRDGVPVQGFGPHEIGAGSAEIQIPPAPGGYSVVVSNVYGMATSAPVQLVAHYVNSSGTNPIPPYLTWETAATRIQDAIDHAAAGAMVLVTNGVYASGGRSADGVITNRVCVDKSLLVQSVNGAAFTTICGALDAATNGAAAVRCAWLTNNATLVGFTLTGGATRAVSSSLNQSMNGGGVVGNSKSALAQACVIATNYASNEGGGAYSVTLRGCTLAGNHAVGSGTPGMGVAQAGSGGGVANSTLYNCILSANSARQSSGGGALNCAIFNSGLSGNSAPMNGGAASGGTLVSCTVVANTSSGYSSGYGGAVYGASLTNCIIWGNFQRTSYPYTNFASSTLAYCCTEPLASGPGNISVDPQLIPGSIHLLQSSPCRGAGNNVVATGTDIDGQPWSAPPSMGCDEWHPTLLMAVQPFVRMPASARRLTLFAAGAGQEPLTYFWTRDGTPLQEGEQCSGANSGEPALLRIDPEDAGLYQVVISNVFGSVTSEVARVTIHTVHASGANPTPPYSTWATAATNIQDAIDISSPGDIVLVTNGVYASGGKVMSSDLLNRVAIDKPIAVLSVNGHAVTAIEGRFDPASITGPGAVRCAYLTNGAVLSGFTVRNGATRGTGLPKDVSGGGVWCATDAAVFNCVITNNAAWYGGGVNGGTVNNSLLVVNRADWEGAGSYLANLNHCTVADNKAFSMGIGGVFGGVVRNSIVVGNLSGGFNTANYGGNASCSYCCTYPLPSGPGNFTASFVQSLDWQYHIAATSPCRGAGNFSYSTETDLDSEPWANPPSVGCDEVILENLTGPLAVHLSHFPTNVLINRYIGFWGEIAGRASTVTWTFGEDPLITNRGATVIYRWTNAGDYNVVFTAYNLDNLAGVSTNVTVHVSPVEAPDLQAPVFKTNGMQFQFTSQPEANYTVQYTTNLAPPILWQTIQTIRYSPGGTQQISDSAATNFARFYRVLAD